MSLCTLPHFATLHSLMGSILLMCAIAAPCIQRPLRSRPECTAEIRKSLVGPHTTLTCHCQCLLHGIIGGDFEGS